MTAQSTTRKRPDGWWYPYIFVGGFAVVIAVNSALFYFATSTFNGLETDRHWEEMNNFNARLDSFAAQGDLGWTVSVTGENVKQLAPKPLEEDGEPVSGRSFTINMSVVDANEAPVSGLSLEGVMWRPTRQGFDIPVVLAEQTAGVYVASVSVPMPGLWELRSTAEGGAIGISNSADTVPVRMRHRFDIR